MVGTLTHSLCVDWPQCIHISCCRGWCSPRILQNAFMYILCWYRFHTENWGQYISIPYCTMTAGGLEHDTNVLRPESGLSIVYNSALGCIVGGGAGALWDLWKRDLWNWPRVISIKCLLWWLWVLSGPTEIQWGSRGCPGRLKTDAVHVY